MYQKPKPRASSCMLTLYLIRHGETDYNRRMIVQGGGIDADLNETGQAQGKQFFEHYKETKFDQVYCTGLKRTYQTVSHFESLGHDLIKIPEMNELNYGVLEGVKGNEMVRKEFQRINRVWGEGDLDARVEKGESPREAWTRVKIGLEKIRAQAPANGTVLVCIHGRIMRVLLSQMLGFGMQYMHLFPHHNTALNLMRWFPNDTVRLDRLNDLSHLNPN